MRNFSALLVLLSLAGCFQGPDRAPVILGAKPPDAALAERVARQLEKSGCTVVRRFDMAAAVDADRALTSGAIDATLESQRTALVDVLKKPVPESMTIEHVVRSQYIRRDLLWSPPLGRGDLAVVFRKDIDRKCREATRALMRTAWIADNPGS